MAIVKFGPMVVGARGTLAGTIFSANKSGPFVRGWSRGSNPRSTEQSDHRALLTQFAAQWRDLTDAEHDDWDDYADDAAQAKTNSLGEEYFVSGFNWFVAINMNLDSAGAASRDDAPTLTRPAAPVIEFIILRENGGSPSTRVRYDVTDPALTDPHVVFATVVSSLGRQFIPDPNPRMTVAVPNVNRDVSFPGPIDERYGPTQLGQRMLFSTVIQDAHGQRGPLASAFTDAVA